MTAASPNPAPGYANHPGYRIDFEPCAKRVAVVFAGETIAESTDTRLLQETAHAPLHYFPRADVRMDLLKPSDHTSHCPFKGDASYWTIEAGGRSAENAVWGYAAPFEEALEMANYVAFYAERVDALTVDGEAL